MKTRPLRVALLGAACAIAALGHYTWIAASPELLETGKRTILQIGHGHAFPATEEAINARQTNLFVVAPSGAKTELKPVASKTAVNAEFVAKESGFHRIVLIQDRGINSRTPDGVKQGGRDKNSNAAQAYRTLRTAVSYANTAKVAAVQGKPLGLEFELTGTLANGVWTLQLLKHGKPAAGVAIEVFLAGRIKTTEAGKTGADGKTTFRLAPGMKGPVLFLATMRDPAPSGTVYDFTNYETSLNTGW